MRAAVANRKAVVRGGGGGQRGPWRGTALAALAALALAGGADGCSKRGDDDVTTQQSALTVPVPPVTQFAVLASRNASFDDRTRVTGGSVGVASTSTNTLTAGFFTHISEGQLVLSPRVVLKDDAATGEIGTNSFTPGARNVTGPVSAYVAPPAQPTPGTITAGSTPVTVPLNGTRTLAAGSYGAVLVDNNATLNLSGGLYQFASLTVNVVSHVNVLASTTVRVSGNVTGLDRSTFLPSSGNASGFRLIVGGATNAVTLGNDVQMKALVVARGDVKAGDRYIFSGAISGRDVIIGHDAVLTFAPGTGFQCATNANCDDANTCTTDACGDALCTHTTLPNNTACNDGNACTQTDRCASGVCVGSNPVACVALDQCHDPGVCAPATGLCSNPNKANGTTCSDGNTCTGPDACSAGVCVGAKIVNCGACPLPDSDEDGVNDCTDKCPKDPHKTSPGICGCGVTETDTDGDGVPDCIEGPCSGDPRLQKLGQCGGCGTPFAAAGTRCTDGPCNGNFTCDGAGLCGSAGQCPQPQPTGCKAIPYRGKTYWFCPGPLAWPAARDACKTLQAQLVEIEDEAENLFVTGNKNAATVWIGANNRTAPATWRWATAAGDDGDVFWTGGASGLPYFARFASWAAGSPDASGPLCASLSGSASTWSAGACTATAGYVCEVTSDGGGGETGNDPHDACQILGLPCPKFKPFVCTVNESDLFGTLTEQQMHDKMQACTDACAAHGNASAECAAACQPPVNPPPASSTCPPFADESLLACALKAARTPAHACASNADCNPGEICGVFTQCAPGQTQNCPPLVADDDPNPNDAARVCGTPADGCATNDPADFPSQCDETSVCDIEHPQDTPTFDPTSDLTPETFDPATKFPTPDSPSTTDPYPDLGNPCPGTSCSFPPDSPSHPWCKLGLSDQLSPRASQAPAKSGRAGGGKKVSFEFDPRLNITRDMKLGPLGVPTTLTIKAEAGLTAQVVVDSSIGGGATVPILDANAAINATRCGVNSTDTRLTVLGIDFLPLVTKAAGSTFPFPLSQPSADAQAACNKAFDDFSNAADRAKKALRDAVELLRQYKERVATADPADNFSKAICAQIAAHPPRGFPAGNCGAESVEDTINRFIDYYTRSVVGFGGVDGAVGLSEAADFLSASAYSIGKDITLYSFQKDEEITVFQAQFFVGPIPVSLELLATMDYGATIGGRLDFDPGSIIPNILRVNDKDSAKPLASVTVGGQPNAGAGMALFAGVGFSVPGFTAKIGIEGTIHLGDVFIDAHAGSGVGLGSEIDDRGPPADMVGLVSATNLIPPKRLVAELRYEAGLGAGVRDVLSGDIAIKLKIKIAFFSKTWRKRLFSFKGFCARPDGDPTAPLGAPCDVTLVSAVGTTTAATGAFPWGAVRAEMPFPALTKLTTPAPEGTGTVATDRVEQFFYDSMCTCINNDLPTETRTCFRNDDCCSAKPICFSDATTPPTCVTCRGHAQTCRLENGDSDCCAPQKCITPDPTNAPNNHICSGPLNCGASCARDEECMSDLKCDPTLNNVCWAGGRRCQVF